MTYKIKEPVRIRQKKLANGNVSLYLAIYVDGQRSYEFLKLYLIPETNKATKERNKETLALANSVKAKRIVEIQNGMYGFNESTSGKNVKFFDYFEALAEKRRSKESAGNRTVWRSALGHLKEYAGGKNLTLAQITPTWIEGFKDYLETAVDLRYANLKENAQRILLAQNTKRMYFAKLRACLNAAYTQKVISSNPMAGIKGLSKEDTERDYLTIDEVKMLAATECDYPAVKRAFLFACLTGLRYCDIMRVTWGKLTKLDGRMRLQFRQKKTGGFEYLDISAQAAELIGEQENHQSDDTVFVGPGFSSSPSFTNTILSLWAAKAGINKHVTFHVGRHTFAVMMLTLGTDIYTVSKLLGHRDLKTTQVYAKIVDAQKQEAVDRIPKIF